MIKTLDEFLAEAIVPNLNNVANYRKRIVADYEAGQKMIGTIGEATAKIIKKFGIAEDDIFFIKSELDSWMVFNKPAGMNSDMVEKTLLKMGFFDYVDLRTKQYALDYATEDTKKILTNPISARFDKTIL